GLPRLPRGHHAAQISPVLSHTATDPQPADHHNDARRPSLTRATDLTGAPARTRSAAEDPPPGPARGDDQRVRSARSTASASRKAAFHAAVKRRREAS